MSRDEYITYLAEKVSSGDIDFDRVRKECQRQGLGEEDTRSLIWLVDDEVQWRHMDRTKRQQARRYMIVGTLMTMLGMITTITFMGSGPVVYFIGYAPFSTGIAFITAGQRVLFRTSRIASQRGSRYLRNRMNI